MAAHLVDQWRGIVVERVDQRGLELVGLLLGRDLDPRKYDFRLTLRGADLANPLELARRSSGESAASSRRAASPWLRNRSPVPLPT
jgi:hypothetical protein